jgi:rSAM/selenodomain-associated transferase 1
VSDPAAVVLFARAPVLAGVKTRLARGVGDARALELYRWLGARVAARVFAGATYRRIVAFTPADAGAEIRAWLPGADVYTAQADGDLGARMAAAIAAQRARGASRVVVVGTDCPAVDAARVAAALARLDEVPCVLGPALDGGYYLIGEAAELPVFSDMPWGTGEVLAATRARLRAAGLAWAELAPERDIDTADDLVALADVADAPAWTRR